MRSLTSIALTSGITLSAMFGLINVADATEFDAVNPSLHTIFIPVTADEEALALQPSDQPQKVDGLGQALGRIALEDIRGRDDGPEQEVDIDGRVTGNTANRIVSGTNTISDGAFSNAGGINTVIQNSGSNVLIQNGMVVVVQFGVP